jgi:thioredoxin 1
METNTLKSNFQEILQNENLVLVDFFAEWCGPCQMMKPILSELKDKVGDKVRILKVDVDKNPEAARVYQVRGVPTLALFQKGKLVWRQAGVMQAGPLSQLVNQYATT